MLSRCKYFGGIIGGAEVESNPCFSGLLSVSYLCFLLSSPTATNALRHRFCHFTSCFSLEWVVNSSVAPPFATTQSRSDSQMSSDQPPCTTTLTLPQIHLVYSTSCPTHTTSLFGQELIIQPSPTPPRPPASHRAHSLRAIASTPMALLPCTIPHNLPIHLHTPITNITTLCIKYSHLLPLRTRMPSRFLCAKGVPRHLAHRS